MSNPNISGISPFDIATVTNQNFAIDNDQTRTVTHQNWNGMGMFQEMPTESGIQSNKDLSKFSDSDTNLTKEVTNYINNIGDRCPSVGVKSASAGISEWLRAVKT